MSRLNGSNNLLKEILFLQSQVMLLFSAADQIAVSDFQNSKQKKFYGHNCMANLPDTNYLLACNLLSISSG